MNVKAIIFDLDDTLYNEIDYVYSGFRVVAKYFSDKYNIETEMLYNKMVHELETNGRGEIFDNTLKSRNIYTKTNLKKAISLYRTHTPDIKLSDEALQILNYFILKDIPLYIVTDGNKVVQAKKIYALGLETFITKSFITHRYGKIHAKPSTHCFEKIARLEGIGFRDLVYIADNVNKDFVGINKLGFQTIRIKNGMFKDAKKPAEFHAHVDIQSLLELKNILKAK